MTYQAEQRSGYHLYYEERDRAEAEQACLALETALRYNRQRWGFPTPRDLHMVIMTGWWSYILAAAPPGAKVSLILSYPLWAGRVRRIWKFTGGWQNRYGRRFVIGIKPPRLIAAADRSLGRRIYVDVDDMVEKMRHMVYHEITHACAAHLRLPAWLNEGLAMLSVDGIAGWRTVQPATVELLDRGLPAWPCCLWTASPAGGRCNRRRLNCLTAAFRQPGAGGWPAWIRTRWWRYTHAGTGSPVIWTRRILPCCRTCSSARSAGLRSRHAWRRRSACHKMDSGVRSWGWSDGVILQPDPDGQRGPLPRDDTRAVGTRAVGATPPVPG